MGDKQVIPEKIVALINSIPEGGAIKICNWFWYCDSGNETCQDKILAKIDGRLNFSVVEADGIWEPVFVWVYTEKPEEWEEHFDLNDFPLSIIETLKNVF
jgi:hypothetical protein